MFNVCTRSVFQYYHTVLDQTYDTILNGSGVGVGIRGYGSGSGTGDGSGSGSGSGSGYMPNGAMSRDIIVGLQQEEEAYSGSHGSFREAYGSFSPTGDSHGSFSPTMSHNPNPRGNIPPINNPHHPNTSIGMDGLGSVDGFNMGLEEFDDNSILNMHMGSGSGGISGHMHKPNSNTDTDTNGNSNSNTNSGGGGYDEDNMSNIDYYRNGDGDVQV